MDGANFYFNISPETYEVSLYFNVANTGDSIRVGLKNTFNNSWVIFDNFRLFYNGSGVEAYRVAIETLMAKLETVFDAATLYGIDATAKVNAAKDALSEAVNGTSGDACMEAINAGEEALAYAKTSIEDYAKIETAITNISEAVELYQETATPAAIEEAIGVLTQLENIVENPTMSNEEVEALLERADKSITAMKLPDYSTASAESPVEFTDAVIVNHNFDEVEIGDFTGWSGTAFGAGGESDHNAEHYNKTYNTYQDISGLVPGYYVAFVQGYYRHGSAANDYTLYTAENPTVVNAYFYAVSSEDSVKTVVQFCSTGAVPATEASEFSTHGTSTVGDGLVVPNYMTTATDWFNVQVENPTSKYYSTRFYNNLVQLKVGDDGKLRIGVEKSQNTNDNDWSIFDNFKLFFIGQNPDPTLDTAIEEIEVSEAGRAANGVIYNLAGQRLSAPVKGLNIIGGKKYFVK